MKRRLIIPTDQGTAPAFKELFDEICFPGNPLSPTDVVLFEGGTDVNPKLYGENRGINTQYPDYRRDRYEQEMFEEAQFVGASCLGICRGAQFLTVMSGGRLIQDVRGHLGNHPIQTYENKIIEVTSTHHQMMYPFEMEDYALLAWAKTPLSSRYLNGDNKKIESFYKTEPEIVWYPKTKSLAIQGHPEYMKHNEPFPSYCRELIKKYLFNEENPQ